MRRGWKLPLHSFLIWLPIGALLVHGGDCWHSLWREEKPWVPESSHVLPSAQWPPTFPNKLSRRSVSVSAASRTCCQKPFNIPSPKVAVQVCCFLWCCQETPLIGTHQGGKSVH